MEKLFDINQHKYTRLNDESPKIMHFNYSEFQPKKKSKSRIQIVNGVDLKTKCQSSVGRKI